LIKFVSDLGQVGGFLCVLLSSTNKTERHDIAERHDITERHDIAEHHDITERHDIAEILLKVTLNTVTHPFYVFNRKI
jgi:hypothetical protein